MCVEKQSTMTFVVLCETQSHPLSHIAQMCVEKQLTMTHVVLCETQSHPLSKSVEQHRASSDI